MRSLDIAIDGRRTLQGRRCLAQPSVEERVTLADLLEAGPLPAAAALDALRDVAEELRARWEEHTGTHGDLKPWTVVVLPHGRATLADPNADRAGGSRRGDAYWFAVLACELLTGTRPIERADAACLMSGTPGFPPEARQALLTCLNPRPKRRPLPHQLVEALEAVPASAWHLPPDLPDLPDDLPDLPEEPEDAQPEGVEIAEVDDDEDGATEGDAPPAVVVAHPLREPDEPDEPAPCRPGFLRRLGPWVAALCVLSVPASAVSGAWMLGLLPTTSAEGAASTTVAVESASLTVTPPTTHCPRATVQLDTRVVTNGEAGTLRLVFWLPGGNRLHERTVRVDEGQAVARAVAQITVAGDVKLKGSASVTVHPGGERAWAPFRFDC